MSNAESNNNVADNNQQKGEGLPSASEFMARARDAMAGKWGLGAITMLLYWAILIPAMVVDAIISNAAGENVRVSIAQFVISAPLMLGVAGFFLRIVRNVEVRPSVILAGFSRFGTALGTYFFMMLFVFLWMLLLIVPGIIAAFAYAQAFYILVDDPNCGALEAIRRSKEMMKGHKGELFILGLRFIGWFLLGILSMGIGFLWIGPYMGSAFAAFYEEVKPQPAPQLAEQAANQPGVL